jgi:hypothetical protein
MSFSKLNAQKTVNANVPADGALIHDAIAAVSGQLEQGDSLVITVDPGTYIYEERHDLGWGEILYVDVLIKGSGADNTEFKFDLPGRPGPDNPGVTPFHSIFSEGNDSSTFTMEGIKFMYGGNYTEKGGAVGAVHRLFRPNSLTMKFENCIFESNCGLQLFNAVKNDISYSFNNCQFTNNLLLGVGNSDREGIITVSGIKSLSVTNCTFMSNEIINRRSAEFSNKAAGAAIDFAGRVGQISEVIIENNAFINTKVNIAEFDTILAVVRIKADTLLNITMRNNIFMGNYMGAAEFADLLLINPENMNFTSEGNIMNKVLRLEDGDEPVNYLDYTIEGALIDETYSYTDPRIDFEMDFDVPKLTADEFGIGHVNYSGNGTNVSVNQSPARELNAYVYDGILKVKNLKAGDRVDVYNIVGVKVKTRLADSDIIEMSLPKGIFIIKSGHKVKKVYSR